MTLNITSETNSITLTKYYFIQKSHTIHAATTMINSLIYRFDIFTTYFTRASLYSSVYYQTQNSLLCFSSPQPPAFTLMCGIVSSNVLIFATNNEHLHTFSFILYMYKLQAETQEHMQKHAANNINKTIVFDLSQRYTDPIQHTATNKIIPLKI